jgi:hypothetical protein
MNDKINISFIMTQSLSNGGFYASSIYKIEPKHFGSGYKPEPA